MIRWLAHTLGFSTCPECEVLVEYAMDGLPENQQGKVRQHLSDCPPCREQVRDYWQVREGLGLCAGERDAPDDLCAKVLARLSEQPCALGSPVFAPRLAGWPRFWMLVGPACAALSLVMTFVALAALLRTPVAAGAAGGNELAAMTDAVVNDPRAAHVTLAAAGPRADAAGLLVLCPGMDHAYLRCRSLSPCPLGHAYVLWMRRGSSAPQRMASFTVEKAGTAAYLLQLDSSFEGRGAMDFMVTQQGASPSPGPAWLKGSVSL